MNFKNIPYKTEWVEYPDIEALCLKLGTLPTSKKNDGRPHYTLPVIYDPTTNTAVAESVEIVKYLDETYPETPKLFPDGSTALQAAFYDFAWSAIRTPLLRIMLAPIHGVLTSRSAEYFRRTREEMFGKRLEELGREEDWTSLKTALTKVDSWLSENGPGNDLLMMGDRVSFVDLQLAAFIMWVRVVCREDSEQWKRIASWHGGRWQRLVEYFDKYATVDA